MVSLVAIMVVAAVLGLAEGWWQPRMAGGGKPRLAGGGGEARMAGGGGEEVARLRSRRLVQQGEDSITRAIQEVRLGLEEDTEELIVPEWFEGFGDKEVVKKKKEPTKEPVKDWLGGSGRWTRKQPPGSKGRKDPKTSQGSARLNLLTRNKDVNKDPGGARGDDETRVQVMSIVKRRRRPEKKEQTLRGVEKVTHDTWPPQANSQTTMAPSTYQDYKTSAFQQTSKKSSNFAPNKSNGNEQTVLVRDQPTTGFQDFFRPRSTQELFGLEARGGHHAKRCKL